MEHKLLAVEIFAAKDNDSGDNLMMAVPCRCGLRNADTLRVNDSKFEVMKKGLVLPIQLPELSKTCQSKLLMMAKEGRQLPVGEFLAGGLFDAYYLNLMVG